MDISGSKTSSSRPPIRGLYSTALNKPFSSASSLSSGADDPAGDAALQIAFWLAGHADTASRRITTKKGLHDDAKRRQTSETVKTQNSTCASQTDMVI